MYCLGRTPQHPAFTTAGILLDYIFLGRRTLFRRYLLNDATHGLVAGTSTEEGVARVGTQLLG